MMLVYKERIIQVREIDHAIEALFETLDLDEVELQVSKKHLHMALEKYDPTFATDLMLMIVHGGEATPQVRHSVIRLDVSDVEAIASILRNGIPEIWGEVTRQQIVEGEDNTTWIGVKVDDELVSLCSFRVTEWAGHVGRAATRRENRNHGYATSLVSYAVEQMLQTRSDAIIFVRTDDPAAI